MNHECQPSRTCRCSIQSLDPKEDCAVHGSGEWPPRCEVCGRFLSWPSWMRKSTDRYSPIDVAILGGDPSL